MRQQCSIIGAAGFESLSKLRWLPWLSWMSDGLVNRRFPTIRPLTCGLKVSDTTQLMKAS